MGFSGLGAAIGGVMSGGIGALAGGYLGGMGSGGSSRGGAGLSPLEPAWQRELRKKLGEAAEPGALERIKSAGEAYPGELYTPMTDTELGGVSGLEQYLASPLTTESPLYQAGRSEIEKTLSGEYDPYEGEYYKAYKNNLMRELRDAKDRLAARTSARDQYFGGGRIKTEGRMEEGAMGDLAQVLGGLYEKERATRLATAPEAMRIAGLEERMPAERAQQALQFGAYLRNIQEAQRQAEMNEWLRQRSELGIPLEVATGMSMYKPDYYYQPPRSGLGWLAPALTGLGMAGGFGGLGESLTGLFSGPTFATAAGGGPAGWAGMNAGVGQTLIPQTAFYA